MTHLQSLQYYAAVGWQKLLGLWQSKTLDVDTYLDMCTRLLLNALLNLKLLKDVYPLLNVPPTFFNKAMTLDNYLKRRQASHDDDVYLVMHKSDCWLSDFIVMVGQLCGVDIQPHRVHVSLWYNGQLESLRTSMTWVGVEYDTSYDPTCDTTVTGLYRINVPGYRLLTEVKGAINVLDKCAVRSTTFTFLRALVTPTTMVCSTYVAALVGVQLTTATPNTLLKQVAHGVIDAWEL